MLAFLLVFFGAAFTVASMYGAGRAITRKCSLDAPTTLAVGAAVLSTAIFFLRFAEFAKVPWMLVLGLVFIAIGVLIGPYERPTNVRMPKWLAVIALVFAAIYVVHALAPETNSDANVYHLLPGADAARTGGFSSEVSFYDSLPQGIENLFAMVYEIGGSSSAKLVHLILLFATVPVIVSVLTRLGTPENPAWIAAVIYFCCPVVGVDGSAAFNDCALTFFALVAIDLALQARHGRSLPLAIFSGIVAGFCYAVKPTGGFVAVIVLVIIWWPGKQHTSLRARTLNALALTVCAIFLAAPWLVRNAFEIGNPVAPLLNSVFPNRFFYPAMDRELQQHAHYGLTSIAQTPVELTIHGERLQGLFGPVLLLAPLGLFALRTRTGRLIWILAMALAIPWFINWGTRFLLQSLPFVLGAMAIAVPRQFAVVLAVAHAITSFPWVVDQYARYAWHLHGFPIKPALRIISEPDYLKRTDWDYNFARMVEQHTAPSDQIFDLIGIHRVFLPRTAISNWQSGFGRRMTKALHVARITDPGVFYQLRSDHLPENITAMRLRWPRDAEQFWSIQDVSVHNGPAAIVPGSRWKLRSWPNRFDIPFAFDRAAFADPAGNIASGWSTWQPARTGMYLETTSPVPFHASDIVITGLAMEGDARPELYLQTSSGQWTRAATAETRPPYLDLRKSVTRLLRNAGITHIALHEEGPDSPQSAMITHPADWGVQIVGQLDSAFLLKIE